MRVTEFSKSQFMQFKHTYWQSQYGLRCFALGYEKLINGNKQRKCKGNKRHLQYREVKRNVQNGLTSCYELMAKSGVVMMRCLCTRIVT